MDLQVMGRAQQDEPGWIVRAARGSRDDVVDLQKSRRAATGYLAAAVCAAVHEPADARRDGLRGLAGFAAHVGIPDVLRVAARGFDLGLLDIQLAPGSVARPAAALFAQGHCDLIRGPACVGRTAERVVSQHADRFVVVERVPDIELEAPPRLTERGQRIARDLQAQHVSLRAHVCRIARPGAGPPARHHVFHLAHRLSLGRGDPLGLGRRHRHAGQLAHRGPAQLAAGQRVVHGRQPDQRLGHPQPLAGHSRPVAEHVLQIGKEAAVAERLVHAHPLALEQPPRLLGIVGTLRSRQPRELPMHSLPRIALHPLSISRRKLAPQNAPGATNSTTNPRFDSTSTITRQRPSLVATSRDQRRDVGARSPAFRNASNEKRPDRRRSMKSPREFRERTAIRRARASSSLSGREAWLRCAATVHVGGHRADGHPSSPRRWTSVFAATVGFSLRREGRLQSSPRRSAPVLAARLSAGDSLWTACARMPSAAGGARPLPTAVPRRFGASLSFCIHKKFRSTRGRPRPPFRDIATRF